MRILFRGKPKTDLIDWIYGCYFWSELSGKHYIMGVSKDYGYTNIEVIPETVGQYTGLSDKNGKEIFEGDIVIKRTNRGKENCIVKFDGGMFHCGYGGGSSTPTHRYTLEDKQIKIIGNIHDTPELLEVEDD